MLKICGTFKASASGKFKEKMSGFLYKVFVIIHFGLRVSMIFPFVFRKNANSVFKSAFYGSFDEYFYMLFSAVGNYS